MLMTIVNSHTDLYKRKLDLRKTYTNVREFLQHITRYKFLQHIVRNLSQNGKKVNEKRPHVLRLTIHIRFKLRLTINLRF